jgi:superoxide dismutase
MYIQTRERKYEIDAANKVFISIMMMMFTWTNYKRGVLKNLSSACETKTTANKA